MRQPLAWALVVASLIVAGGMARAEPRATALPPSVAAREAAAHQRSARASALYDAGKYDDALRLFLAAYDLAPLPDILFNVGLSHEKMLDHEGCVRDFRRYLREGKDALLQARAKERLAHCEALAQLGVHATSIPTGAAITIADADGRPLRFAGRTPLETKLVSGTYRVRAELPGYEPLEQRLVIDVDAPRDVDFPLAKLATLAVDADTPGATARVGDEEAAPLPLRRELRAGAYHVTVTKEGHRTVTRDVRLGVGEQSTLLVALPALPQIRTVAFDAEPGALVVVDGQPVGGARRLPLEQGVHRVEVSAPGAKPYGIDLNVPANRDVTFQVALAHGRTTRQRALLGVLAGAALATAGVGGVMGLQALDAQSRYEDTPSLAVADEGRARATTADILFSTAVLLSAAAVVTYLVTSPGESTGSMR